jgi:hypothetical protein
VLAVCERFRLEAGDHLLARQLGAGGRRRRRLKKRRKK